MTNLHPEDTGDAQRLCSSVVSALLRRLARRDTGCDDDALRCDLERRLQSDSRLRRDIGLHRIDMLRRR